MKFSIPGRHAKDSIYHEEEERQGHDSSQANDWLKQGADQNPHAWHCRQAPERSEQPESPETAHVLHARKLLQETRDNHSKIQPIPSFTEVAIFANNEALGYDLAHALQQEHICKHGLKVFNKRVDRSRIIDISIVFDAQ